jgi:hypothetical protein
VGRRAAFPERQRLTLNLRRAFVGETVRIRFRIGTDQLVGGFGWELDNLEIPRHHEPALPDARS